MGLDLPWGQVTLVGAGCHDASWLTQAGYEALKQADAVVYDDLIDPSLLDIPSHAILFYRGKRGHLPSAKQTEIQDLLLSLSQKYRYVVRLKGGDPMVFGRALEEIAFLEKHHVPVQIIPGISSFLGVLAKEQFGLTKRNQSNGFMVLTATSASQERSLEEWKHLAAFSGTLVFLMGMSKISSIQAHLIEAGMDPKTPAAIFTSPTMTLTQSLKAPLDQLEQEAQNHHLQSPGLIVIGGSVQSFTPLQSIRIGLTSSNSFNQKLKSLFPPSFQSVVVLENHYQDFELPLKDVLKIDSISHQGWLVFTSAHGVERFLDLCCDQKIDLRSLTSWKLATIGPATAKVFQDRGLWPELIANSNSISLSQALLDKSFPQEKIVLFQSQNALPTLFETLKEKRWVKQIPLYAFSCASVHEKIKLDYVLLASLEAANSWPIERHQENLTYICLSKRIAHGLQERFKSHSLRIQVAAQPTALALAQAIFEDQKQKKNSSEFFNEKDERKVPLV